MRLRSLYLDVRAALKGLRRQPWGSIAAILVLALGIAGSEVIVGVARALLLKPLPYPGTLAVIRATDGVRQRMPAVSGREMATLADAVPAFELASALRPIRSAVDLGPELGHVPLVTAEITPDFFALVGVVAVHGRLFDATPPNDAIVLSEGFWRAALGADLHVVGSRIDVDGEPRHVIGIAEDVPVLLPDDFGVPSTMQAWLPLRLADYDERMWLRGVVRLRPGNAPSVAQAQLDSVAQTLDGIGGQPLRLHVEPLRGALVQRSLPALRALMLGAALLLGLAIVSTSQLLLVRNTARRTELCVRAALGAGRTGLARLLAAEAMVIAVAAGVLGTLAADLALRGIALRRPPGLALLADLQIDPVTAAIGLAAAVLCTVGAALIPIARATRPDFTALRERDSGPSGGALLRRTFVAVEMGVAVVLLVSLGLITRSLERVARVDPGFDLASTAYLSVRLPAAALERQDHLRDLLDRVRTLPGVVAAGSTQVVPLSGRSIRDGYAFDDATDTEWGRVRAEYRVVSPGLHEALGLRLLAGRFLTNDDVAEGRSSFVVDDLIAARAWPGADPIGQRIRTSWGWGQVVGVVAGVRDRDLRTPPVDHIYAPVSSDPRPFVNIVVRTAVRPESVLPGLRSRLEESEPGLVVFEARTLESLAADRIAELRYLAAVLSLFAFLAYAIAGLGAYALMAFEVGLQTRALAIRSALGASGAQLTYAALTRSVAAALLGVVAGVVLAPAAGRLEAATLFGVSPWDPGTIASAALALILVTLFAGLAPAVRVASTDPRAVLDNEI